MGKQFKLRSVQFSWHKEKGRDDRKQRWLSEAWPIDARKRRKWDTLFHYYYYYEERNNYDDHAGSGAVFPIPPRLSFTPICLTYIYAATTTSITLCTTQLLHYSFALQLRTPMDP